MSATPAIASAAAAAGLDPDETAAEIRRLLARGSDLTLANGDTVTVVYTARTFARIEIEYGSLNEYLEQLRLGTGGRLYGLLAYTLSLILGQSVDRVWDLIDTRRIAEYVEALGAAVLEAMPSVEDGAGNGQGPTTAPSPGDGSSMSSSSTSTSARTSSGA